MKVLSRYTIGTWPLSGDYGPDGLEKDNGKIFDQAYSLGFKRFDTAPNYGSGFVEKKLGKLCGNYNDISVTTKIGNHHDCIKDFSADRIKRTFELTVKNLNGHIPDIVLFHNPRLEDIILYNLFVDIRSWLPNNIKLGFSMAKDQTISQEILALAEVPIQIDYNYLYIHPLESRLTEIQARSVFASGILLNTTKGLSGYVHPRDHRSVWVKNKRRQSLMLARDKFHQVCLLNSLDPAIACLSLCINNVMVKSIVIGVKNTCQLKLLSDNIHIAEKSQICSNFASNLRKSLSFESGF